MDRTGLFQKLKGMGSRKIVIFGGVALALVAVAGAGVIFARKSGTNHEVKVAAPAQGEAQASSTAAGEPVEAIAPIPVPKNFAERVVERFEQAFQSVHAKGVAIQGAMEENSRLRLENAHLRLKLESLQFDCHSSEASSLTREMGLKLTSETKTRVGRTLAAISYKPPVHLLPPQLYTLGVSYFMGREDEKAAVILTFLTGLEENDAYKTPRNLLMTAVAWYRLDNLELADQYLDLVLKAPESPESLRYQAQARLWKALSAERLSKPSKAQYWMRDLVDHHPYSTEAGWINGGAELSSARTMEVNRATASED